MRPLEGLRVLDLTRILAGPIAGRTLADVSHDVDAQLALAGSGRALEPVLVQFLRRQPNLTLLGTNTLGSDSAATSGAGTPPVPAPQLAALNRTNVNVQELAVEAALTGNPEHVLHAVALDPLTAALLTLSQIRELVGEMLEAERAWLPPEFAHARAGSEAQLERL